MNAVVLITGGIAALLGLGAYLRWAVKPALASYRIGVDMGRMLQAQPEDDEPSRRPRFERTAVLAWLMPWRAARIIREYERNQALLIRTLANAVADSPDREAGQLAVSSK